MERDEMPKSLCRSGCGFYGSSATDGLCSVCFKEALKKKCVPNQPTASAPSGPSVVGTAATDAATSAAVGLIAEQLSSSNPSVLTSSSGGLEARPQSSRTSSISSDATSSSAISDASQSVPVPADEQPPPEEQKPTKAKNRCDSCKKKVGLTGFDCRCGGLYCAIHRYSDKHDCSYNYREQGAAEIRRNNPQIMGQKINKI